MGKTSGGTRNYSGDVSTIKKRKSEFDAVLSKNSYRESYFDNSGGYYVVHENHGDVNHKDNKEQFAAKTLAKHGYRAYLMSEKSYIEGVKKNDGFAEHSVMDIKTISTAGKYRLERSLKNAALQGSQLAIIVQNTPKMNRAYVENQIQMYKDNAKGAERGELKAVWIIGSNGHLHRHKL